MEAVQLSDTWVEVTWVVFSPVGMLGGCAPACVGWNVATTAYQVVPVAKLAVASCGPAAEDVMSSSKSDPVLTRWVKLLPWLLPGVALLPGVKAVSRAP